MEKKIDVTLVNRLEIIKKHLNQRKWILEILNNRRLSLFTSLVFTILFIRIIAYWNPYEIVTEGFDLLLVIIRVSHLLFVLYLIVILFLVFIAIWGVFFRLVKWIFKIIWSKNLAKRIAEIDREFGAINTPSKL